MLFHTRSREIIEGGPLPGPSAVIRMADSTEQLAKIKDEANVVARLNLVFNDASESFQIVTPPSHEHARQILEFVRAQERNRVPNLVAQCEVGIGRSQGVLAALHKIYGLDPKPIFAQGTYNRALYRAILVAAGITPDAEPLVSIAVRVKYSPERLHLFLLSMRRQRYENWEVVAVTDGPNHAAAELVHSIGDKRVRLIQTEKPLGRWGRPYRQIGLDACQGEFIGMSNDDNYYVPGYLEQMVSALDNADLAICRCLHSYIAWAVLPEGVDLGSWIARATLVRRVPWTGTEFYSDQEYRIKLKALASARIAEVKRPLFIHN